MRGKPLGLLLVAVFMAILMPRDAFALIGWIERLSGPGPFKASTVALGKIACFVGTKPARTAEHPNPKEEIQLAAPGTEDGLLCLADRQTDEKRIVAFLTVEFSSGRSTRNDLYDIDPTDEQSQVRLTSFAPMFYWRPQRGIDVGAGWGFNRFSGRYRTDASSTDPDGEWYAFWRSSIPIRLHVTPAELLPQTFRDRHSWLRAFYYGEHVDIFTSRFRAADFGVKSSWQSERPDYVRSRFVGIDVFKLFPAN